MRRAIAIGSLTLLLLSPLCAAVTPGAAASQPVAPAAVVHGQLTDRDGDGVADNLQQRLATAQPEDRFDVVVTFREQGHAAAARQALGPFVPRREFKLIPGFAGSLSAAQIRALSHAAGLVRIEEDVKVHTQLNAARADFGVESARGLAVSGLTGRGVGICTVDTGVDPNHEQLAGKVAGFVDLVANKTVAYDDNGHGTHVLSIAAGDGSGGADAARYQGVAPGAPVYAAKVLDSSGSGAESAVVSGIDWCAAQAAVRVISLSLAALPPADGNDAMSQAVNAAVDSGKVVVVAAGNDGDEPGTVGSPGAAEKAITVGACAEWSAPVSADNHSEGVYLTAFSSRGPITVNASTERIKPDICGPGHTITAAQAGTVSGYVTYSGTSMATPFVAGTVALALEANPALTPAQVRSLMEATAQDRGSAGKDNEWGTGLIDAYAFVARAQNPSSTVTTAFPHATHLSASVGNNSTWSYGFDVSDTGKPIAAIVTIIGQPICTLRLFGSCFAYQWDPDLDARLLAPDGTVLSYSGCMGEGTECASPRAPLVALGRQETLHAMPTTTGQYRVEVWGSTDSVNQGKGGSFAIDLSQGPLANVIATPDFTLAASPLSQSVVSGSSVGYDVTVTPSGGFSSNVALSLSNLPAGASASFNPASLAGSGTARLTVSTSSSTPSGSYPLNISGSGGGLTRNATVTLAVNPPGDFALSVAPGSQTIKRGGSGSYTITLTTSSGFSGSVAFSASGLPKEVSTSFSPGTLNTAGTSLLTVNVGSRAKRGSYTFSINGNSGSLSRSVTAGLKVQ
ncbi:S8 family serine peptidase [Pseudogulbenkiania ferrooxidans]|uniref:Peptidase S8 and S53 subtilisin kexin sedolisin n=1 Tax=Pseudogulbenkiania ferrooxidans 2002 TaxID=279714 RepID=B9Z5T9_9NEIS|nr:S8 family serine peptidase [Pseudogulbenkiania ferrooxidans]EEG07936.1 peptidase S8 and S53 subtilisin kexin sedolisin [Pseudogulbenkiania ferrooxidans 2002]